MDWQILISCENQHNHSLHLFRKFGKLSQSYYQFIPEVVFLRHESI